MNDIKFSYQKTALVSDKKMRILLQRLAPEISRAAAAWDGDYSTPYSCLRLPIDTAMHERIFQLVREKKAYTYVQTILIGIGGSNLGVLAVYQALTGKLFENADSVDPQVINELYLRAQANLEKGDEILLIVVSKSGTTTETVANAQLFSNLLKKYRRNYHDYMVIISDENSPLAQLAKDNCMSYLSIAKEVGGRYSVLSAAGLFPLAMMGIDIRALCAGAASVRAESMAAEKNQAAERAAIVYAHAMEGAVIYDQFFFVSRLYSFGLWFRQLFAESLGKSGAAGILPTVSIGSADLHSVAQLYLGGANNRITSFITMTSEQSVTVPVSGPFASLVPVIADKTYTQIMDAIAKGVQRAYLHEKRAFVTIQLSALTPYAIGQLLYYAILETIYLGYLFQVNPFDQPQVELYKKETRKILADE